jgi:hypothetical protein
VAAIPSAGVRESNSMSNDNRIAPSPGPFMNRVKTLSALHRLLRELATRRTRRPEDGRCGSRGRVSRVWGVIEMGE